MAEEIMVSVGYEGKQYRIPAEIARLNATQPGVAKAWIEEMLAEESERQQQVKQRKAESVEAEFTVVKTRLSELESERAVTKNLQRENASLRAAVDALVTQLDAIESSGNAAGSASAEARQTAYDLSNASTIAQGTLSNLQRENERLNSTVMTMQAQLDQLQAEFNEQASNAIATGRQRGQLLQEASNRALDESARAEAIARQAEAVAAQALRDAAEAKIITKDQLTALDVENMVNDGINAGVTADRIADVVKQRFIPAMPNVDKMTIADLPDPVFAEKPSDNQMDREVKKALKRGKK